ncbi:MAG: hypothetical protein N2257_10690 [Thermodesulfovibrionales bacterium]|nr:hypothetical protein [Thermodesulfovibrionales bacterium]
MNKELLKILTNKPEIITDFPRWMLPESAINEILGIRDKVIAEIAGRDSIAAVIRACEIRKIEAIIPTIAYTGTEYGDWDVPFEKINFLKDRLKSRGIKVFEPVLLGAPRFWWRLCGRYSVEFSKRYGFYSHCVGCHLYLHAIRIPLTKILDIKIVVGGERESHDGRLKVNQIGVALDAYVSFMKRFGIELFLPLRFIRSGKEIEKIIGSHWDEGKEQLHCVLSKNYLNDKDEPLIDEEKVKRFLEEVASKIAEDTINEYLRKGKG